MEEFRSENGKEDGRVTEEVEGMKGTVANLICYLSSIRAPEEEIAETIGEPLEFVKGVIAEAKQEGIFNILANNYKR